MRYSPQDNARNWPTFKVALSNGKTATVKAPSPQRALQRMEREIAKRSLTLTVTSVTQN